MRASIPKRAVRAENMEQQNWSQIMNFLIPQHPLNDKFMLIILEYFKLRCQEYNAKLDIQEENLSDVKLLRSHIS